ncbi:MAG: DUF3667 domain-containing protein [Flavobacterium sp.]|nr:MAG: DUF3667 domain-containing protein [Flavobacterium sp.]
MNKGFLYSIKKILRGPGKTAREFVEGNRVNHYKPILLVFVVAGISAFLTNTLIHPEEVMQRYYETQGTEVPKFMHLLMHIMLKYQAILMLLSVPFMAFFTWIAFRKWGYNYYENIVITAYSLVCLQVLTTLIVTPLQFFLKGNLDLFMKVPTTISYLLMFGIFPWFYLDLYNTKNAGEVIMRLFLLAVICFAVFMLLCIVAGVIFGMYMVKNNIDPNTFMGIKPI